MQWLSLLLVCLLATQSVNAIRYASVPNKQYVQVAIAFEGTTCAQVSNGGNILRNGARDSVKAYFSAKGYSQTIIDSTAGLLDTECVDSSVRTCRSDEPALMLASAMALANSGQYHNQANICTL